MNEAKFIPLKNYNKIPGKDMINNSYQFYLNMNNRRTVRQFSKKTLSREVIENCIRTAGTAPSGANLQPWHFVVVNDKNIKRKIRIAAEEEEKEFYNSRAPKEWLDALALLGTDEHKPFLETAPCLIVIFTKRYEQLPDGTQSKYYYSIESTGIACGMLITAIHNAGLVSLTHTPSSMNFLNEILNRPINEKPFLILVVGYPAENAMVPDIKRKKLEEISTFI